MAPQLLLRPLCCPPKGASSLILRWPLCLLAPQLLGRLPRLDRSCPSSVPLLAPQGNTASHERMPARWPFLCALPLALPLCPSAVAQASSLPPSAFAASFCGPNLSSAPWSWLRWGAYSVPRGRTYVLNPFAGCFNSIPVCAIVCTQGCCSRSACSTYHVCVVRMRCAVGR